MTQVSVSDFRQNLPTYLNRVFAGEEFEIVKNKLPVAVVRPMGAGLLKIKKRKILSGATSLLSHLKGSTIEVADRLRKEAWYGKYVD